MYPYVVMGMMLGDRFFGRCAVAVAIGTALATPEFEKSKVFQSYFLEISENLVNLTIFTRKIGAFFNFLEFF